MIHGMLNPASSVAHSLGIVEALRLANKDFDMLLLPNESYPVCGYAIRRSWDYLVKHLLGVEPPREFDLITGTDILLADATLVSQS